MAIKKSNLYSSLWASCDKLRGGMDASQYKDYVLFMLFIKYISDKYANSKDFAPAVKIPRGASFDDMVALKGKPDIGDRINKEVIAPLADANDSLSRYDFPDFDDSNKLGDGAEKVERLTDLIGIFQDLDFSQNRAEEDDLLGDAYEYLIKKFADENKAGATAGQFYTPPEVRDIIIRFIQPQPDSTFYDPTCGSGGFDIDAAKFVNELCGGTRGPLPTST